MKRLTVCTIAALLGSLAAAPAFADHNSPMGECWANMPNDIHNLRMDTLDGDQDEFLSFIQYGDGAELPNRCPTTATSSARPVNSESKLQKQTAGTRTNAAAAEPGSITRIGIGGRR